MSAETGKLTIRLPKEELSPELDAITGLLPADIDAEQVYREHLARKHR